MGSICAICGRNSKGRFFVSKTPSKVEYDGLKIKSEHLQLNICKTCCKSLECNKLPSKKIVENPHCKRIYEQNIYLSHM